MGEGKELEMSDGWIEWAGGECPVAPETQVGVRHRDGGEFYCGAGRRYAEDWSIDQDHPEGGDIIAYRVVQS